MNKYNNSVIKKKAQKRKNKKVDNFKIKLIVFLFIILMAFLIYSKVKDYFNNDIMVSAKVEELFSKIDKKSTVNVSKYIVYGTHLNLEGNVPIPEISDIEIEKSELIIQDINGNENSIKSEYTYKDSNLSFSTINEINSGLNLEELTSDNYYIFLKVSFSNSDIKYYSLTNNTEYPNVTYYTITKNGSNNKLDINFDNYNNTSYMGIKVSKDVELPSEVYDIAIDPGHGGTDSGATSGKYHESTIVLDCAKKLKSKLEALGLKVFLTRDGSEPADENTAFTMYDENGRVNIANESHSKILISLHLNSNTQNVTKGGVEVYAPSKCNLTLAKSLANNIVTIANTNYSRLSTYKKHDGVYVHNYSNYDIMSSKSDAIKKGYEPYNLNTDTPYLYMIREIGGICTNAFVDGRNPSYGTNKYVKSNVGIEGYLIELGYMIIKDDLNNILSNGDNYMQAISNSIRDYYNLN